MRSLQASKQSFEGPCGGMGPWRRTCHVEGLRESGVSVMYPDLNNLQLLKEASCQTTANIVIEPSAGRHLLQQLAVQYTSATSHL